MSVRQIFLLCVLSVFAVCSTACQPFKVHFDPKDYVLSGGNYEFAIYTGDGNLLTHPLERLSERRSHSPFSDVYVISHGWNYTIPEAIANFHSYIEIINAKQNTELKDSSFRPFFIFVVWSSVTRPFTDVTRAILPFDLDSSLSEVTGVIDKAAFFLPSVWKQSLNAHTIALGRDLPERYRTQEGSVTPAGPGRPDCSKEIKSSCYDVKDKAIGADFPLSAVVHQLFKMKHLDQLDGKESFKIHLVGHSYGAKVVSLAGMEALRRWQIEQPSVSKLDFPLESLLMMNPAMNVRELEYIVDVLPRAPGKFLRSFDYADVDRLLRMIPRKGIIYSKYDYPNGVFFDFSQILLNNHKVQVAQVLMNSTASFIADELSGGGVSPDGTDLGLQKTVIEIANKVYLPVNGVIQLGTNVATGIVSWAVTKIVNLPYDLAYHCMHNNTFPASDNAILEGFRYGFNGLNFFLPIDHLIPGESIDQLGIFRPTKPALGKGGLYRTGAGRPDYFNNSPLENFISESTDIDPVKFCNLSQELFINQENLPTGTPKLSTSLIYSFDGSSVFEGGLFKYVNPTGSHSDVGTNDKMVCTAGRKVIQKREFASNFLYNFTKTMMKE